jgi:hypothetical protein
VRNPLMLALTGTPLINDVEDFDAIWRFLGWTNGEKPGPSSWRSSTRPDSRRPTRRSTPRRATP